MYRRLQSNFGKTKDATFVAATPMKKGMLVQKDYATLEVDFPSALTATDVYIVDFEPDCTGLLAIESNVSDYDARKNDIATGAKVTLELLEVGEVYATDQFVATSIVVGSSLEVSTAGMLVVKATGTSPLVATNIAYDDAGNTLLAFAVTAQVVA